MKTMAVTMSYELENALFVVVKTPDRDLLVRVPVGAGDDPGVLAESVFAGLCSVEWFMADSMTEEQAETARAAAGLTPAIELSLREEAFTTEDDACRIADVVLAVLDEHTTEEFMVQVRAWDHKPWVDCPHIDPVGFLTSDRIANGRNRIRSRRVTAWEPVEGEET